MKIKKNPDIEIGRNSSLFFAIGLNLILFFSWQAIEYKTYSKASVVIYETSFYNKQNAKVAQYIEEEIPAITYTVQMAPPLAMPVLGETLEIVEDEVIVDESVIQSTEVQQGDVISPNTTYGLNGSNHVVSVSKIHVEDIEEEVEVPFSIVEDAPVFPGCEGVNKAKLKDCFQEKIQAHILSHFKYPQEALNLGIQGKVSVIFTIDSKGFVSNLKSRGPERLLEIEAERIISLLPQVKPGKQRGKPVKVTYAIPIYFKYAEQ